MIKERTKAPGLGHSGRMSRQRKYEAVLATFSLRVSEGLRLGEDVLGAIMCSEDHASGRLMVRRNLAKLVRILKDYRELVVLLATSLTKFQRSVRCNVLDAAVAYTQRQGGKGCSPLRQMYDIAHCTGKI